MALDKATLITALEALRDGDGSISDFADALEAFVASATVTVTVTTGDAALQTSTTAGTPTSAPAVPVDLTGTLS